MHYSDNLIFLALFIALVIRVSMHFIDKNRIKDEVEAKGGRIMSITWNPLGRGWFFEKGERHYQVDYIDHSGVTVSTGCKTSLFTGIYWAEGPRLGEPTRIISRLRCGTCGYALKFDWRACPNCGKATEIA